MRLKPETAYPRHSGKIRHNNRKPNRYKPMAFKRKQNQRKRRLHTNKNGRKTNITYIRLNKFIPYKRWRAKSILL